MGRKKKSKARNDTRGYNLGGIDTKKKVGGVSAKTVQVTSKTHEGLVDLLGELSTDDRPSVDTAAPSNQKRLLRKVTNIHDGLHDLGFKDASIEDVVQALGHSDRFTIESALDWLCLNVKTEDLPALFTEGLVRDEAVSFVSDPNSLTIITAQQKVSQETEPERVVDEQILPHLARAKENKQAKEKNEAITEDDRAAQKAWLLQQYQYEYEEDDEEQEELDGKPDDSKDEVQETNNTLALSPEEIRLVELEKQLEQDEKDLNDDAANYMRSKYETKELQNRVKKSRKMVQGLRKKVAQLKAKEAKQKEVADDSDNEEGGNPFSIFDSGTDVGAESMKSATTTTDKEGTSEESKSETKEANISKAKTKRGPSSSISSVPKNWTGKTPKKILEEWCQKRKTSKPQFQKIAHTSNGCRIVVKENTKRTLRIDQEGPFASFGDAQEYLATEALYALNPTLPLYRLFPPVFRDLWRSWMDHEKEEKEKEAQQKRDMKMLKMKNLAQSIPNAKSTMRTMTTLSHDKTEDSFGNIVPPHVLDSWDDDSSSNEEAHQNPVPTITETSELGKKRKAEFTVRRASASYQNMLRIRKSLPMYEYRQELLDMIGENQVTILCAETGAGKTTQAGQFILEEALLEGTGDQVSILCTQPRRVAAISVAERVSEEMCENEVGGKVGYHIRMETKRSSRTQLLFCTTGVVLRRLQDDPNLTGVTHVLVDEVHERQWQIDFLLIALRALISTTRKDLKVILMSATLDAELFCSFFQGAPLLSVPGRTFPVSSYYLEDLLDATDHIIEEGSRYARREIRNIGNTASLWVSTKGGEKRKEVVALESETEVSEVSDNYPGYKMSTRRSMDRVDEQSINYDLIQDVLELLLIKPQHNEMILPPEGVDVTDICNGAVLVFLPGLGEIRALTERLENSRFFGSRKKFEIIPLHSTLSPKDQRRAFVKPPKGCQKIILSTNIAETSVTIPDVVCVIDTGLVREVRQNKKSFTSTLVADWCSRASAKQRSGRAGRVQPGICCKLYSSRTANYSMQEQAMPELQRVPLEEVCLTILASDLAKNCMEFLQQAPQAPSEESVVAAINLLQDLGAIDATDEASTASVAKVEHLTPLGQHLAKLPVNVRLGKMLIFGCLFRCLDKTLTVAASLSCKSPFSTYIQDSQQAEAKHKAFAHATSDFFTICNVWNSYRAELEHGSARARKFCDQNYLNRGALLEIRDMRNQFLDLLRQIGFVSHRKSGFDLQGSQYNVNGSKESVIGAVICAGLYPNVAHVVTPIGGGDPTLWHGQERVHFHNSSVNAKNKHRLPSEWVAFFEKFATHRTYISATSYVDPFALLLFGGRLIVKHIERKVLVDDWIELKIAAQTGVLFRELRVQMDFLLESMMLKVDNISEDTKSQALLEGIVKLLSSTEQTK